MLSYATARTLAFLKTHFAVYFRNVFTDLALCFTFTYAVWKIFEQKNCNVKVLKDIFSSNSNNQKKRVLKKNTPNALTVHVPILLDYLIDLN